MAPPRTVVVFARAPAPAPVPPPVSTRSVGAAAPPRQHGAWFKTPGSQRHTANARVFRRPPCSALLPRSYVVNAHAQALFSRRLILLVSEEVVREERKSAHSARLPPRPRLLPVVYAIRKYPR